MPRAFYFLGKSLLGFKDIDQEGMHSIAYLCDRCGPQAWATILVDGADSWGYEYVRCEAHPDDNRMRVSGSFIRYPYPERAYLWPNNHALAIENLPRQVLAREVHLHCAWVDRVG